MNKLNPVILPSLDGSRWLSANTQDFQLESSGLNPEREERYTPVMSSSRSKTHPRCFPSVSLTEQPEIVLET